MTRLESEMLTHRHQAQPGQGLECLDRRKEYEEHHVANKELVHCRAHFLIREHIQDPSRGEVRKPPLDPIEGPKFTPSTQHYSRYQAEGQPGKQKAQWAKFVQLKFYDLKERGRCKFKSL